MARNPGIPKHVSIPMEPSEKIATSVESFRCWNCGEMYPTDGRNEGRCPVCGQTCTRERCEVLFASNEGY